MTYDANGNMITRAAGSISWYSYNLPNSISYSGNSTQFFYNANHQRWKQVASYSGTTETTHYIGGMLEIMTRGANPTEYRHQIPAGSGTAVYTRRTDGSTSTYYATSDHLGSSDLVTDASANVLVKESFTPFGARRGSAWTGSPSSGDYTAFGNTTRRGFTQHEMLDSVALVHMNGRVYDPYLGRFLSADTVIQTLAATESINPYAYGWNDPLKYVDPSGHSLLGDIIGLVAAIVTCGAIAAFEWVAYGAMLTATSMGFIGGFVGGFVGALVSTGSLSAALTAGLIVGITGAAFAEVGDLAQAGNWDAGERVLAHAAVGCGSAMLSGGNCGRGALAAGIAEAANRAGLMGPPPKALASWGALRGAAEAGLLGGIAAQITGGKFDDGFTVAAAGYLFNAAQHHTYEIDLVADPGSGTVGHVYLGFLIDGQVDAAMGYGAEGDTTSERIMNFVSQDGFPDAEIENNTADLKGVLSGANTGADVLHYSVDQSTYYRVMGAMYGYLDAHPTYVLGIYDCVSAAGFALAAGNVGAPLNVNAMQWGGQRVSAVWSAIQNVNKVAGQ
jgi:RHS repeat-associated protein